MIKEIGGWLLFIATYLGLNYVIKPESLNDYMLIIFIAVVVKFIVSLSLGAQIFNGIVSFTAYGMFYMMLHIFTVVGYSGFTLLMAYLGSYVVASIWLSIYKKKED